MAGVQEQYDFHTVLDTVWEYLLDELELDPVLKELEKGKVFRRSEFRDLQEKHPTTNDKISALLQLVKDGDYTKYDKFKKCLVASRQEQLVKTIEKTERGEYNPVMKKKPRTEEEKLFEVLKEDLIEYYRDNESTMSVAPLVEQHETELTKFYVRPPMKAYNNPNAFGQKKQSEKTIEEKMREKTNIESYSDLLLKDSKPYRGIYVTADAGMGKTSLGKMLAITWCEAHTIDGAGSCFVKKTCANKTVSKNKPKFRHDRFQRLVTVHPRSINSETEDDAFTDTDLNTLGIFEYLFLIKLHEYSDKCMLDDMILEMIKSKLKNKTSYTEEFLEKVLCNKCCLIIVDGLDEWIHPKTCRRKEDIPHRRPWPGCTVLTTTRP